MSELAHSEISRERLVELCARSSYTLDGLWFVSVEDRFGLDAVIEIDAEVWRRLGLIQAKRIQEYFSIDEGSSIRNLIRVIELDPLLVIYKPKAVELTDNRAVLRCTDCPPQEARIRSGRGEFPCKPVGIAAFTAYAQAIDPKIKMTCRACPPDGRAPGGWCEWQFELETSG